MSQTAMSVYINQSIFILDTRGSDKNLPYLMGLSEGENLACQLIIIVSLFCGTFLRLLILRVVKHNGWFRLPINTLIFEDQVSRSQYETLFTVGNNIGFVRFISKSSPHHDFKIISPKLSAVW